MIIIINNNLSGETLHQLFIRYHLCCSFIWFPHYFHFMLTIRWTTKNFNSQIPLSDTSHPSGRLASTMEKTSKANWVRVRAGCSLSHVTCSQIRLVFLTVELISWHLIFPNANIIKQITIYLNDPAAGSPTAAVLWLYLFLGNTICKALEI